MKKPIFKPVEALKRLIWRLTPLTNNTAFLSHFCALLGAIMVMVGCSTIKYVPIEGKTEVKTHYVDSVRWNTRDSVILVEKSIYKDYVGLLDTLTIESGIATAKAWADTSHNILNGYLEGKSYVKKETKIEYRDRLIEKTDTCYIEKPIPYEVEKVKTKTPKWVWWSLALNILTILGIALKLYLKLK